MSGIDTACTWSTDRLADALALLARRSGLGPPEAAARPPAPPAPAPETPDGDVEASYLESVAAASGFELEPVAVPRADLEASLRGAAPALLRLGAGGHARWAVLAGAKGRWVRLLGTDGALHRLAAADLAQARLAELDAPDAAAADRLLADAGLAASPRARSALLRARRDASGVDGLWLLRLPPSARFSAQLREAGLRRRLGGLVAAHGLQYALWILAWWAVGAAALRGRPDLGWLGAWALLLATLLPLRLAVTWLQGHLALHAGALLKRRLLAGALRQRLDDVRRWGIGRLLGRVLESNAVEALALGGGLQAAFAALELAAAAVVLALGAGGGLHAAALAAWTGVAAAQGADLYRRQAAWTAARLGMTHRLVERMVGHRTRLAQEAPERRHADEDAELAPYHAAARTMDRAAARLQAVVPRGWLVVGVAALTPAFVERPATAALAVALGGTLLAYQAFHRLGQGLAQLNEAAIAARRVAGLFRAAAEPAAPATPPGVAAGKPRPGEAVLEARGLTFRYAPRAAAVVDGADLTVHAGDRLLLEGPSGSGKSTLAALLGGLRDPDAGLLLLRGLDRPTLGREGWRRRVAAAPQFHHNHVVTGSFAFNLLMGRRWPPAPGDLEEAERLCRALGLGDLLDRMPAGLFQMVGETGWQLSHGERSRLFLARALLQRADVVILDESFGALDPENRARALRVTLDEAPSLLVIAHP